MTVTGAFDPSLADLESWAAIGGGVALVALGVRRRSLAGLCLAVASAPLFYRGVTGSWPALTGSPRSDDTRVALGGDRGIHVREAVRLERPLAEVYRYWRTLANLPLFMQHLDSVTEQSATRSRWVARGPAGLKITWDAEIVNEVEGSVVGWRSLPGADVVTAGSVHFDPVRNGRSTQVTVHLQYAPPGGTVGAWLATLLGRAPSQTLREDLRRLKQLLEAGELAQAGKSAGRQ